MRSITAAAPQRVGSAFRPDKIIPFHSERQGDGSIEKDRLDRKTDRQIDREKKGWKDRLAHTNAHTRIHRHTHRERHTRTHAERV